MTYNISLNAYKGIIYSLEKKIPLTNKQKKMIENIISQMDNTREGTG